MKDTTIYSNLIGCLTKKGKKFNAIKILDKSLYKASENLNTTTSTLLLDLSIKLSRTIEVRQIEIKNTVYDIPFPIKARRRRFLFSKELTAGIAPFFRKSTASDGINEHISSFLLKRGSNFNLKNKLVKDILFNRSNTHYRW